MKKALITGADGFIGSHLTEMLLREGYSVKALSLYNSFNNWGWLEDVEQNENLKIVSGDIRDPFFCKEISKDVDIIFHLAALIAIPYSYISPNSFVETNIKGTLNICQAAKENGNIRIIHTSTSEVYGTAQYLPINEKHPLQPQSPYSASKIGADAIARSFFYSYNLPLTIARPFNTYGPRQSARAVIPTIITQIASGKKSIKLGDINPIREFNYVEDTCKGFKLIVENDNTIGEVLNIGSNNGISIKDLFILIKRIMKSDAEYQYDSQRIRPAKSEVLKLSCDYSKIKKATGYEPEITLEEGLRRTIKWFASKENLAKYKTEIYNV